MTNEQYKAIIANCKSLFMKKALDYGTSWTILRMPSVTDQIMIKADRIRTIQEKKVNKVGDSIEGEFIGMINYCIIALILLDRVGNSQAEIKDMDELKRLYEEKAELAYQTMLKKNHDYGESWRKMRISSMTDLILMKIMRLKQIEDNEGKTIVSEGVDANYIDILNYSVFCLILDSE